MADNSPDTAAQDEVTQVVCIQDATGITKRIRINGGPDFPVQHAGPVSMPGATGFSFNVRGVEIKYEKSEG